MKCREKTLRTPRWEGLRLVVSVLLALVFTAYLSTVHASEAQNIRKINGSIKVHSHQESGNVKSVNGSIRLDQGARAGIVSTVNGSIHLRENSEVQAADTVNGSIRVQEDVRVADSLSTVNGLVNMESGSQVGRHINTVNGTIRLSAAHVGGNISTVNGAVRLLDGSTVAGDLIIKKRNSRWMPMRANPRKQVVEIGPGSRVEGTLHLMHEVDLIVHDTAYVREVRRAY
jgi:hypothetical protein